MPSNESSATTSVPNAATPGATFLGTDTRTSGNWKGVYGAEGYNVMTSGEKYPGYATVNSVGSVGFQWSDTTTDARALQMGGGAGRVAGCWFALSNLRIDYNFIDGTIHKLSLYFMDWDQVGRNE